MLAYLGGTIAVGAARMAGQETASTPASSLDSLINFRDSEIKFPLATLMAVLRDNRHEGWVLAAYPDPTTSRPLIGAGFSLDVPATDHPQSDPLNPHTFLEPSSAQLWQAAGLDPGKLQRILAQYDRDLAAWQKKKFRRKIRTHRLPSQITEAEATALLRISATQAVHNARAYCRDFDQLTSPQQMALSQLVYQMGLNLEQFVHFLDLLNNNSVPNGDGSFLFVGTDTTPGEHWSSVQDTLIQSQWARRYSTRAVAVIAMFDPDYAGDPAQAERKVRATLHPAVAHSHKKRSAHSLKTASTDHKAGTGTSTGKS